MRTIRTSVFCFGLLSLTTSIAAGQAPATYVYCYGQAAGGPQRFSTPFEADPGNSADGRLAFLKYLEQKYAFKGLVRCTSGRTLGVARAELKKVADDAKRGMNLRVETQWVYVKTAATPPAPPVPAPQPVPPAPPPAATAQ